MLTAPPIHSTALHPVEFIPPAQDAATYRRTRTAELRQAHQALEREQETMRQRIADNPDDQEAAAGLEALLSRFDEIQAETDLMERTAATMKANYPNPQVFFIAVPTSVEREQINSRLVSLGLNQVTQEMIRAMMIEELYHQDWSAPGETLSLQENEARAEDNATFLDSVWLRQGAHDAAIAQWEEQEVERLLDEWNGAPARPRAEVPVKIITMREGARMQILVERMMSVSQRLRDLAASNMDFGRRNAILLVRMHLVGVDGFTPTVPIERDPRTRALPEAAVAALREKVDDTSWNQLVGYIDRLYQVDGGEEKNFASRPEKRPPQDGSTEHSGDPEASGGSSTGSSSTPAPDVESERTTAPLSASTSGSSTAPGLSLVSDSLTVDR